MEICRDLGRNALLRQGISFYFLKILTILYFYFILKAIKNEVDSYVFIF